MNAYGLKDKSKKIRKLCREKYAVTFKNGGIYHVC